MFRKKVRVPKGRKYYYITDTLLIDECFETDSPTDKLRFDAGNYFHSPHRLSDMALKLTKVLEGADVIDMPSEEEIKRHFHRVLIGEYLSCDRRKATFSEGCMKCYEWLKSKIVKF